MRLGPIHITLIDDWPRAWRLATVVLSAALSMLAAAWEYMPELQAHLPAGWFKWAFLIILLARLVRQPSVGRSGL